MRVTARRGKEYTEVALDATTVGCIRKSRTQNRGQVFAPGHFTEFTAQELRQIADKMDSQVEAEINSGNHYSVAPGGF